MLVLSRKVGQRIMIGDNITILVSRISGKRVTLGLEAPKEVHIRRAELGPLTVANNGVEIESNEESNEEGKEESSDEEPDEEDVLPPGRAVVCLAPHPFALL